jgi:hypothetical protein
MDKRLILFLSANPRDPDYPQLDLIKECNDVADNVGSAKYRNEVTFVQRHEVSVANLQKIIAANNPQIVHFTGHGEKGQLVLEGLNGETEKARAKALSDMFRVLNARSSLEEDKKIRCVVFSACYSRQIARAVAKHVDFVVGMANEVRQDAASSFAVQFYYHLCSGESFKDAFDFAKNQIELLNIPGQDIPKLEIRNGIDASCAFLFEPKVSPDIEIEPTQQSGPRKKVLNLVKKYNELIRGKTTVREFWEDEDYGGLCNILLYFSTNARPARISEIERNKIDIILASVPPKLISWDLTQTSNPNQHYQLDAEIRRMYAEALDILRKHQGG